MRKFLLGLLVGFGIAILAAAAFYSIPSYGEKIAVMRIKGTITSSPSLFAESISPESVFSMIDEIEKDPSVKGVLIELNSPGGSVVASREISMAVRDMDKPTVCWMGDLAASGAYWIASACDTIVADPLTLTGSIGVTASYLQFAGTLEKYGVTYERFVSGESKDAGSPFRNTTEEEREEMDRLVSEIFAYFLEDVAKNRDLDEEAVERVKDGGLFLGKEALEIGLVDELGTWQDAKVVARNSSGAVYPEYVEIQKRGMNIFDLISAFL
ncbi:MAG: signal peptide peptidase SppA [Candidatus Aenigmarchaeota archaeon]|nr:signal peptide peptidase SppA [Candidatus Aenigmarchaeota archaeon]